MVTLPPSAGKFHVIKRNESFWVLTDFTTEKRNVRDASSRPECGHESIRGKTN